MQKYLFTDGTNVIREVESDEELQSFIQSSAEPGKVRIWIFNTNEWLSLADFNKRSPRIITTDKKTPPAMPVAEAIQKVRNPVIPSALKKILVGIVLAAAIFLVYNFTKATWRKTTPLSLLAEHPANTPAANVDSLIETIESLRGQKLDKITRTNLRIRNTWPDLIQLQLNSDRDTSREGLRYYNAELVIDNSTGYHVDNAVVKYSFWKSGEISYSDTVVFSNISYAAPAKRKIEGMFKGDSASVSFSLIRSKAFNFCYSADKKSNYGNYNDRWYCK